MHKKIYSKPSVNVSVLTQADILTISNEKLQPDFFEIEDPWGKQS